MRKGSEEFRTHFIHFVEKNSNRWDQFILFKKYILENKEKLKEYQLLKEELANKYFNNRKEYTKSKSEFIQNSIAQMKLNELKL